jgi:hypothetical protein
VGVKLGLAYKGKNIYWGCLRTGCWGEYSDPTGRKWRRRLHNEELHILYTSLNVIRVTKPRRMRWVGHVARMEIWEIRGCIQKLPDLPSGARTANDTAATTCSCIAILWVSLVSFVAITIYVASQRVFIVVSVYFVIDSIRKLFDTPSYIQNFGRETREEITWKT